MTKLEKEVLDSEFFVRLNKACQSYEEATGNLDIWMFYTWLRTRSLARGITLRDLGKH